MPTPDFERAVIDQLAKVERELRRIRRGTGGGTIAVGVLVGLILYSVVGIVATLVFWGAIIGAASHP